MSKDQEGTLVTFYEDIFPYVKGDVITLTDAEKARVDEQVKLRGTENGGYKSGSHQVFEAVTGSVEAMRQVASAERQAKARNEIDQSAVLEAQQTAVPEPANVDALGVVGTGEAQVVTGTPSVDVEVDNAQTAVNVGSDEGVNVTKVNGKKVK